MKHEVYKLLSSVSEFAMRTAILILMICILLMGFTVWSVARLCHLV